MLPITTQLLLTCLQHKQAQHYNYLQGAAPTPGPASPSSQSYAVYAKHPDSGYLKHVFNVLERAGYTRTDFNSSDSWSLLWAHDYPFKKLRERMLGLRPGQRVNKFPGSGYITNKVNLATSGLKNVPPAWQLPKEKEKFLAYAQQNPDKMFVQKSNNHRGIQIEKVANLKLNAEGSFVQEFIHNPLLVDGYKFDIGVYTTLTSVDPLRIYVHQQDVLLRFCPTKYHPFDAADKDKYVVGDDYLPSWQVPSFGKFMGEQGGFGFKDTLNAHIRSLGKDPDQMWEQLYSTIVEVYRSQEDHFIRAVNNYPHKEAFFEMVRFDFVIDEDLNVYLMEANMSPNLSSAHFPANAALYEEVVGSLLKLVGVVGGTLAIPEEKELLVNPAACSAACPCSQSACSLCRACLSPADLVTLRAAWRERASQGTAMRRIFPPAAVRTASPSSGSDSNNRLAAWYTEKCRMDKAWCDTP